MTNDKEISMRSTQWICLKDSVWIGDTLEYNIQHSSLGSMKRHSYIICNRLKWLNFKVLYWIAIIKLPVGNPMKPMLNFKVILSFQLYFWRFIYLHECA